MSKPVSRTVAIPAVLAFVAFPSVLYAGAACFPDGTEQATSNAGWTFSPPACSGGASSGGATPPTPAPTPTTRMDATGSSPLRLPALRHPAGGDPVLGDGEFVESRTDVSLAGYGVHYQFTRTYRSGINFQGPLGYNWDHNYDQRLLGLYVANQDGTGEMQTTCENTIDYQDGSLDRIQFTFSYRDEIGNDHFTSSTGETYTLLRFRDGSGLAHWTLTSIDGTASEFDSAGFLSSIHDPPGNSMSFSWVDDIGLTTKQYGPGRHLGFVTDPAGRIIDYVYTFDNGRNVLQCLSLGTDCTTPSNLLVTFNIQSSELKGVIRGADQYGEQYSYLDEQPNADQLLNLGLTPPDCVPSAEISFGCEALCASPVTGLANTCNFAGMAQKIDDVCLSVACLQFSDDEATHCVNADLGRCFWCGEIESNGGCNPATLSTVACTYMSGSDSSVPPGWPYDRTPCCYAEGSMGGVPDPSCEQYYGSTPDCWSGCQTRYQCHKQMDSSGTAYSIYDFGKPDDLRHNIVEVRDEKGEIEVDNTYGVDPSRYDFDKVISQKLGTATSGNVITFDYHDLAFESGNATPILYGDQSVAWHGAPSTSDPIVIDEKIPGSAAWDGLDLCSVTCTAESCGAVTYGPAIHDVNNVYQANSYATVIHDIHGQTRVQYLNLGYNIVRETKLPGYYPYPFPSETSEYNYDSSGRLRGYREASGVRHCAEHDAVGHLIQDTVLPADGYSGSEQAKVTLYRYNGIGRLSDTVVDPLGTPSTTHLESDFLWRTARIDQDVRPGIQPLRTYMRYDGEAPPNGILETPTSIQYPNGRLDIFSDFDPSMGGPRTTVIDSMSQSAEQRSATYDNQGRVLTEGETGRYMNAYTYQADRVASVAHRASDSSPWITTTFTSQNGTDVSKPQSAVGPRSTTTYYYQSGQYPTSKVETATVAPSGTTLPQPKVTCYNYAADGQLSDVILPEGNTLHYYYDPLNHLAEVEMGYNSALTGDWAAGCSGKAPPDGDFDTPITISGTWQAPGGFPSGTRSQDVLRSFFTDGFGNIIQSDNDYDYPPLVSTAIDQFGYDVRGNLIWQAKLQPWTGMYSGIYQKPAISSPDLINFVEYEYDFLGRKTKQHLWALETGEDLLTTYGYDDVNGTLTITDRGAVTVTQLDGRGRVIKQTRPDLSTRSTVHYVGYDVVTMQSNQGTSIVRTYQYDTRGNTIEVDDENNQPLITSQYDDNGNPLVQTAAGFGATTRRFDAFNRRVYEAQDLGGGKVVASLFGWDRNDRMTSYTDANTNQWSLTLNGRDMPLKVVDPLGRPGTYSYVFGFPWHQSGIVEPNGRHKSFQYNWDMKLQDVYEGDCPARDGVDQSCAPLQSSRHYDFYADNKVQQVTAPAIGDRSAQAPVQYTYDSLNRIVDETVGDIGSNTIVHHVYKDSGRAVTTQVIYSPTMGEGSMTHHFDSLGRLAGVDVNAQPLASWNYGVGIGGPLSMTYANGASTAYQYDRRLRQTGMDVTFTNPVSGQSTVIAALHEAFGPDSIPRLRQRSIGQTTLTDVFQVDGGGRMLAENLNQLGVVLPTGEVDNTAVAQYMISTDGAQSFVLDDIGNVTQRKTQQTTLQRIVDQLSRPTTVDGKVTELDTRDNVTGIGDDLIGFQFDELFGAMTSAHNGSIEYTYEYDALERRIVEHQSATAEERFVWDGQRLVAHGDANNLKLDVPGDDIDAHIASIEGLGSSTQTFFHQGRDQSMLAASDHSGLIEGYSYSAFGVTTIVDGVGQTLAQSKVDNRFLFQGHLYDPLTKSYAMRAREYRPAWGAFVSPDPLSYGAAPSLYSFAGGRPLMARDPTGLDQVVFCVDKEMCDTGFGGSSTQVGSGFAGYSGSTSVGDSSNGISYADRNALDRDGNPIWNNPQEWGNGSNAPWPHLDYVNNGVRLVDAYGTPYDHSSPDPNQTISPRRYDLLGEQLQLVGRLGGSAVAQGEGLPGGYKPSSEWDAFLFYVEQQSVDHPYRTGFVIFGGSLVLDAALFSGAWVIAAISPEAATLGTGSLGAGALKILQTGNRTLSQATADILNEVYELDLVRRDWGRALEALKGDLGLANDFHGLIDSIGNLLDANTREVLGNISDYLK
jgi:RHS repeat-associated protein